MAKLKKVVLNSLGVISTLLAILVLYLVLWKDVYYRELSALMITEFVVVTGLTIYTRVFYYKNTENNVRNSEQYLKNEKVVLDAIHEEIRDMREFDEFIDTENIVNYNSYLTAHCKNRTTANYKLSFGNKIHRFFISIFNRKEYKKYKTDKSYYFRKYLLAEERKASKIHKLSSSAITSLGTCTLSDDRNFASRAKVSYIMFGTIFSIGFCLLLAVVAFQTKADIDANAAFTKMTVYVTSMLFNIATTVVTANIETSKNDYEYFRRIAALIDKYTIYRDNKYTVEPISYIKLLEKEVNDASNKDTAGTVESYEQLNIFELGIRDI